MSFLLGILNFFMTAAFWAFLINGVSKSMFPANVAVFFTILGCILVLNTAYVIKNVSEE